MLNMDIENDHMATGSESLAEFARNEGIMRPDRCWLLDSRDVWVRNPYFVGKETPHPEYDDYDDPIIIIQPSYYTDANKTDDAPF